MSDLQSIACPICQQTSQIAFNAKIQRRCERCGVVMVDSARQENDVYLKAHPNLDVWGKPCR